MWKKENIEKYEKKKDDYDENSEIEEITYEKKDERDVDLIENQKETFKNKFLELHDR